MALHEKDKIKDSINDDVYASSDLSVVMPKYTFPKKEHDPRHAYQVVHDELMLDGNCRLSFEQALRNFERRHFDCAQQQRGIRVGPAFEAEVAQQPGDGVDALRQHDPARTGASHCGLGLALVQAFSDVLSIDIQAELIRENELQIRLVIPGGS